MTNQLNKQELQDKLHKIRQKFHSQLELKINTLLEQWKQFQTSKNVDLINGHALQITAHNIAGSGGTFGTVSLSQVAKNIESQLDSIVKEKRHPDSSEIEKLDQLIQSLSQLSHSNINNVTTQADFENPTLKQNNNEHMIYLVDDDMLLSECLRLEIQHHGYQIVNFNNLSDFRAACLQLAPTIVIVDMMFIEGDLAGANEIKSLKEKYDFNFETIFISSKTDLNSRLAAVRVGGKYYLSKPLSVPNIVSTLDEITGKFEEPDYRVLIVDDDEYILEFHSIVLSQYGVVIETESKPQNIFEKLDQFNPEVLLLDINMPDCNGFELAKAIRQHQKYFHLHIIFVSTETEIDKKLQAFDFGGDDFISKPIQPEYLSKLIQSRLKRSRALIDLDRDFNRKFREAEYLKISIDQHNIVSIADVSGNITYTNDKFCEISGYSSQELLGKNHNIVNSGVHDELFFTQMWHQISEGQVWHGEICNRNKSGELYWVDSTIVPFLDENNLPIQYISVRNDITQIKSAQLDAKNKQQLLESQQECLLQISKDNRLLTMGLPKALEYALSLISQTLNVRSSIWLYDDKNEYINCQYFSSNDPKSTKPEIKLFKNTLVDFFQYIETQFIIVTDNPHKDQVTKFLYETYYASLDIQSAMILTIICNGKIEGFLFLERCNKPSENWNTEERNFARSVCDILAIRFSQANTIAATKKLEQNEKRLRLSQYYANIGTWDWHLKTNEIVGSDRIGPLFGCNSNSSKMGIDKFMQCIHDDDRKGVKEEIENCLKNKINTSFEHRVKDENGNDRWLQQKISVICDENQETTQVLGVVQDIHEQKTLSENISKNNALLDIIRHGITQFVVSYSSKDISNYLLPKLMELTHCRFGFIGKINIKENQHKILEIQSCSDFNALEKWQEYFCDNSQPSQFREFNSLIGNVFDQGEVIICNQPMNDIRLQSFDSKNIPFNNFLGIPIYYGDDLVGMYGLADSEQPFSSQSIEFLQPFTLTYGVIINANELAQIELQHRIALENSTIEAKKANQAKSVFLSNMSHELRTPLNAILGFTQLLEFGDDSNPLNEDQLDSIVEIKVASEHLLALINEVLDLSKIESGQIELLKETIDITQLFQQCENMLSSVAGSKTINLEFEKTEQKIFTDAKRLKQILINLITNAIKYNKENGDVIVSATNLGNAIRFRIKDTGIGIPSDRMHELFSSFHRLSAENSNIEGTGIGLVISQKLVNFLGGNIEVESQENVGSVFYFDLPLSTQSMITENDSIEEVIPQSIIKNQILYIDQSSSNLLLMSNLLSRRPSFGLLTSHSTDMGLIMIPESDIDLIILNVDGKTDFGEGFIQKLAAISTIKIPVVALSSDLSQALIGNCIRAGADYFISKPVDINELFSVIDRSLSDK